MRMEWEYRYYYGTGTRFYDKYGNRTPVTSFEPGLLVTIGDVDSEGILTEARISDQHGYTTISPGFR